MFTTKERIAMLKEKINKLENSSKNSKCPGILRKLRRQLRNLESIV